MIKYLVKDTVELRVETEDDADILHKEMIQKAAEMGIILNSWQETKKERKIKGEIVDEWINVKYSLIFNDQKEPITALDNIEYNMDASLEVF